MAGGNNELFRNNPLDYFRKHQLMISPQAIGSQALRNGTMDIDLVSVDPQMPDCIRLEDFNLRKHHTSLRLKPAQPVRAYFLAAVYDNASTLRITNERNYLFTADLSGCLFAAYGANANDLTVEHVNVHTPHARVPILPRAQAIIAANYNFYRILSPVPIAGSNPFYVKVYSANSSVMGLRIGGAWTFHYKPVPMQSLRL